MSNEKKQSFIQEALDHLAGYLERSVHPNTLEHFQTMMEQYLKRSFKNGVEVGMKKTRKESFKPTQAKGQTKK